MIGTSVIMSVELENRRGGGKLCDQLRMAEKDAQYCTRNVCVLGMTVYNRVLNIKEKK